MPIEKGSFRPVAATMTREASDLCPVCRTRVIVRSSEEVMIKNAILRVDVPTGRVTAKCARCKAWREVPLRYVE
jgi:hypothetical protein